MQKHLLFLNVYYEGILRHNIILFVEDYGHEAFIRAIVSRLADENNISVKIIPRSVRGGHGRVISELKVYLRIVEYEKKGVPDLIIVATDANCKGYAERKREIEEITCTYQDIIICAIPELPGLFNSN